VHARGARVEPSRRHPLKRHASLLALLALASTAHAGGIALRWGSCEGTANRNFACDRSTGSELLVGSFSPPPGISQLTGIEMILRITSADGTVPNWWQMFAVGSCRRSSVAMSLDMSDQTDCDDPWSGQAMGGIGSWEIDGTGANVRMEAAVAPEYAASSRSGTTYAAFKLLINHQRSNGAGSCGGCDAPVCVKLEAIRLCQPGTLIDPNSYKYSAPTVDLTDGINGMGGATQVATWQGGTSTCSAGLSKPSTWSELKARFKSR